MYSIGNEIKLRDGRRVKIINLPHKFMSNGSYEVSDNRGNKFFTKPEDILYLIDIEHDDNLDDYFEPIFDGNGLNLIPKNIKTVSLDTEDDGNRSIEIIFEDGRKHNRCVIHIGDMEIIDDKEITKRPIRVESKIEKIIKIVKNGD